MSFSVCFGLLIPDDMTSRTKGQAFLQTLVRSASEWSPERYNNFEPVRRLFSPGRIDEALDVWRSCFLWRRSRPRLNGSAWFGQGIHAAVWIRLDRKQLVPQTAVGFLRDLVQGFRVDLSYLHVWDPLDESDHRTNQARREPFLAGLTTFKLRHGLPDVPWAIFFGPPYVELFGRDRLLAAPAACVEEIGAGIYLQLTPDPADVQKRREAYLAAQAAMRSYLGSDAFVGDAGEPARRLPEFVFTLH